MERVGRLAPLEIESPRCLAGNKNFILRKGNNLMEMEHKEYASKGVAGTGLGLGAAGLGLGVINGMVELLQGWQRNPCGRSLGSDAVTMAALAALMNGGQLGGKCSEDHCVNRYELGLEQQNSAKDSEIALLKANIYGDQKLLEVYKYTEGQLKEIRNTLCAQAVHNQKTEDSFHMVHHDLDAVRRELLCKIEQEAKERCCSDNAIVNYANATFYPKMVADVTTGTTTTAQLLYNPIPDCGCGCGRGN